jgi:hypothetical protein
MRSNLSLFLFLGWLVALVLAFIPPSDPPPTSPAGVGRANGFPVHYAAPAPGRGRSG